MEASAPEKIYLLPDDRNPNSLSICWYEAPYSTGAIEYTCTDAVIEKASEWLKENKDHPFIGCEDPCLSGYLTDGFIEAFKKAMEE